VKPQPVTGTLIPWRCGSDCRGVLEQILLSAVRNRPSSAKDRCIRYCPSVACNPRRYSASIPGWRGLTTYGAAIRALVAMRAPGRPAGRARRPPGRGFIAPTVSRPRAPRTQQLRIKRPQLPVAYGPPGSTSNTDRPTGSLIHHRSRRVRVMNRVTTANLERPQQETRSTVDKPSTCCTGL
jgi:hypothetical protein